MMDLNKKIVSDIAIHLLLLLVSILLLAPVLSGTASFCIFHDNLHQAYPFFYKLNDALHKGYLPIWDANTYGGKSFVGEFQTGVFYPLNVIWCFIFGSSKGIDVYALDLLVCLHYFVCVVGMYHLGRLLRLSQVGSIVSALVFTFTGTIAAKSGAQTCIFVGLTLIPWAIYFLLKYYLAGTKRKYLVFAGLINGLEILGGHVQPFFHSMLISLIIILFYEYHGRKNFWSFSVRSAVTGLIVVFTAIIIALPQIYYALEYLNHAYRWVGAVNPIAPGEKVPLEVYLNHNIITPYNFFNLFGSNFAEPEDSNMLYMGILPLSLVILFAVNKRKIQVEPKHVILQKVLLVITIIGILSFLGYLTFFPRILYSLPFVNAVRELGRYSVLFSFSVAIVAGLAITYILQIKDALFEKLPKLKFYALVLICLNLLFLIFREKDAVPIKVSLPFLLAFLFFLLVLNARSVLLISLIALGCILGDLYVNRVNYNSIKTPFYAGRFYARNNIVNFLEKTYGKYRVAYDMQNNDSLRSNIGDVFTIQTKLGFCATMNKPYFDFISRDWGVNSEVNDLLNVKYIVTDKILDSGFAFIDSTHNMNLYERRSYYPRVYWKSQLGKEGPVIEQENKETIKQLRYSDEYQKYDITCTAADTLIFSENYYPGWKCYDNNRRIRVVQPSIKNYPPFFRAIPVDKGHHTIEFMYHKPFYFF